MLNLPVTCWASEKTRWISFRTPSDISSSNLLAGTSASTICSFDGGNLCGKAKFNPLFSKSISFWSKATLDLLIRKFGINLLLFGGRRKQLRRASNFLRFFNIVWNQCFVTVAATTFKIRSHCNGWISCARTRCNLYALDSLSASCEYLRLISLESQ